MTFETITDEELITLYKRTASQMSYYNAAEREAFYRERNARENCKAELALLRKELQNRQLEVPVGDYLL